MARIEPFDSGLLRMDDGADLWWETSGTPGAPAVVWLHGGPGSGLGAGGYRDRPDPGRWLIVGLDQRGCGRSTPTIDRPGGALEALTTQRMIADVEQLREHLGIERWLVTGGSWGSTLALAYAQAHPERVTGLVLAAVTATSRDEVDWITEHIGRVFPREWEAFASAAGPRDGERIVDAYSRRLGDPNPAVRAAAAWAWCRWEDVHPSLDPAWRPSPRYDDPAFRATFATQVVHLWANSAFLGDEGALARLDEITHIPAVLIHGRLDISSPLAIAWRIHRALPSSRLVVIDGEGHGGVTMTLELERAIASFAA